MLGILLGIIIIWLIWITTLLIEKEDYPRIERRAHEIGIPGGNIEKWIENVLVIELPVDQDMILEPRKYASWVAEQIVTEIEARGERGEI